MLGFIPKNLEEGQRNSFLKMHRKINHLIDKLHRSFFKFRFGNRESLLSKTAYLKMVLVETKHYLQIAVELPGIDEKNIDINITNSVLVVKGKSYESRDGSPYINTPHVSFNRSLRIPSEFDSEKVKAQFKNGILKLTLPKTRNPNDNIKKIKIKSD